MSLPNEIAYAPKAIQETFAVLSDKAVGLEQRFLAAAGRLREARSEADFAADELKQVQAKLTRIQAAAAAAVGTPAESIYQDQVEEGKTALVTYEERLARRRQRVAELEPPYEEARAAHDAMQERLRAIREAAQ